MTAKEIKERLIATFDDGRNYPEGSIGDVLKNKRIKLLNELCTQLCREQREICAAEYSVRLNQLHKGGEPFSPTDAILNAKQPEL